MITASTNNTNSPFTDFINDVIRNASEFPEFLRDLSESVNDDLIDVATRETVEENLRQGELQQVASSAAGWLSEPVNLLLTFAAVIGAYLLFR